MQSVRRFVTSLLLLWTSTIFAQESNVLLGHVFHSDSVPLTFKLPEKLFPKVESEMRQDPSGREHVILALWDAPERAGIPRMAFLYDTKIRPAGSTREMMAERYLQAMKGEISKWAGVKVSDPQEISPAGYVIWRLDYSHPKDSGPPYNAAIVIPLKDRKILSIQINAPSQDELNQEVDSLRELRLDEK
jgi:hypothetical protein